MKPQPMTVEHHQAQCERMRAAMAECDRLHTPDEIAAAERHLAECAGPAQKVLPLERTR